MTPALMTGELKRKVEPADHQTALRRFVRAFEDACCEVRQEKSNQLEIKLPGWDAVLLGPEARAAWIGIAQPLWDRMFLTIESDGRVSYRLVYGSAPQLALHALLTTALLMGAWAESIPGLRLAGLLLFANLLPMAIAALSFRLSYFSVMDAALMGHREK